MALHVTPVADVVEHSYDDCPCDPEYRYVNPRTGETYDDGPLVIHHSLDGREQRETS